MTQNNADHRFDRMAPRERAAALKEDGLTYHEIATLLGVAKKTIVRWLNPEYAARERAASKRWKDANRAANRARDRRRALEIRTPCSSCGEPCKPSATLCWACYSRRREERWQWIEFAWKHGKSMREIAADLGMSVAHVGVEMNRMREAGRDLPYRRTPRKVAA